LHIFILLLFIIAFKKIIYHEPPAARTKISLNIKQIQSKPPIAPEIIKTAIVTPPIIKKIKEPIKEKIALKEKPIIKKKLLDTKNKLVAKKANEENNISKIVRTKAKTKPKKKIKRKVKKIVKKKIKKRKKIVKKKVIKKQKIKKRKIVRKNRKSKRYSKDPLANAIMSAKTHKVSRRRSSSSGMRMIKQFYGSEFNGFSNTQKKFIRKNLGSIYRITQQTLNRNGYPEVALRTQQQGTQLVTFYLHPNGNITQLRLKKRIGYASLDNNTIKVIRIAYKNYPRPRTTTKISFYVEYSLF